MAVNSDAITAFVNCFTPGNANYGNVGSLMTTVFSPEGGTGANEVPVLAITNHGLGIGPAFYGARRVRKVFNRLFNAFPDVQLMPISGSPNPPFPLLTSSDGNTIALQVTMTGTHQDWWFSRADADRFYSKPLSDIAPTNQTLSQDPNYPVAACAVFTFNGTSHLVNQLAMYLDRYKFIENLSPGQGTTLNAFVSANIAPPTAAEHHERRR
jgi:hypothetical protein